MHGGHGMHGAHGSVGDRARGDGNGNQYYDHNEVIKEHDGDAISRDDVGGEDNSHQHHPFTGDAHFANEGSSNEQTHGGEQEKLPEHEGVHAILCSLRNKM